MNTRTRDIAAPSKLVCFGLMLVFASPAAAQETTETDWKLQRDRDGIQVYTRSVAGSPYDAVRSETIIDDVRLSSLVALIDDAPACADWADRCAESHVYERLSSTEALVYTLNSMPFPVKDRDVLAHVKWTQDPQTLTVTMHSSATTDILEPKRGVVRLTEAQASWVFEPLAGGKVKVISEAHINPGSALPGWVTNMLLVETPFETVFALREAVREEKYRQADVSFIRNVGD